MSGTDRAELAKKLRFGDVVENGWASNDNPIKRGFFVRRGFNTGKLNSGSYIELTDGKGKFWKCPLDSEHKLSIVQATALSAEGGAGGEGNETALDIVLKAEQIGHDWQRGNTSKNEVKQRRAALAYRITKFMHPEAMLTDAQVKHMVDRFLGWRLPKDFSPDAGISFEPEFNKEFNAKHGKPPMRHEPSSTNLLDATQAEAMVRYMLEGMSSTPTTQAPSEEGLWNIVREVLREKYGDHGVSMEAALEPWRDEVLASMRRVASPSADLIAAAAVPPDDLRTPYGHCVGRTPFERTIEHIRTYLPNPHEGTDCRNPAADAVFQGMIGEVLAFAMRGVMRVTALRSAGGE